MVLAELTEIFSMDMCDINRMPSSAYISSNHICSTSWLDHILSSDGTLVQNIQIMYGSLFYDHIPVKLELLLPVDNINIATPTYDSGSSEKNCIVWNTVANMDISDYQICT